MTKERRIKDWQRMYDAMTNPEEAAKEKKKAEREARIKEKKSDTGL